MRKIVAFVVFCLLNFVFLVGFCLRRVFVRAKSFRKKKLSLNCPDNLIYYTTETLLTKKVMSFLVL